MDDKRAVHRRGEVPAKRRQGRGRRTRGTKRKNAMFAVLKTGGKQYRVAANQILTVEKLAQEAGETVEFTEVLMLGGDDVRVGAPFIDGAVVTAEVLEQFRGEKVISFKKRRRKHSSQRKRGHRQYLTRVRITDISAGGKKAAKAKAEVPAAAEAPVDAVAEPAI